MTINFAAVKTQLDLAELRQPAFAARRAAVIQRAVDQLLRPSLQNDQLRERVNHVATRLDRLIRAAMPLAEPSSQLFSAPVRPPGSVSLFAGDGT